MPGAMLAPAAKNWLLLGLGLATGMEFYTFDAMNLVLVDLAGTLGQYQASLAILTQLAAKEPANTGWQQDLVALLLQHLVVGEGGGMQEEAMRSRESGCIERGRSLTHPTQQSRSSASP